MKLNNKGVTLVEIIISVALISIVLIFLFSLLIQVNNENSDNEVKSSYLVNQATFIKQIEEDFLDYGFAGSADTCSSSDIDSSNSSAPLYLPRLFTGTVNLDSEDGDTRNIKCLKLHFNDTTAFVFLYKRDETSTSGTEDYKTILSYYRGDFKQSVELEEFDWNMNVDTSNKQLEEQTEYLNNMYTYSLPIIGPDYKDYSINLSYAN